MSAVDLIRRDVPLAAAACGIAAVGWLVGWLPALERPAGDLLLRVPDPRGEVTSPFAAVLIDDLSIERCGPLPWPRRRLARLIESCRQLGATALVVDIVLSEAQDNAGDAALQRALADVPAVLAAALRPGGGWLLPLDRFGGLGVAAHAYAEVAGDGVVRQLSATKQTNGIALPALAVAAARHGGWHGAVSAGQLLRPDFRQGPGEIPSVSADRVLAGDVPPGRIADHVVFVGLSAAGAGDQFVVPVGDRRLPAPGVLVHAAVASALIRGGLLRIPPVPILASVALLLALAVQLLRTRAGRVTPVPLVTLMAAVITSSLIALWAGRWLVPVVFLLAVVGLATVLREAVESRLAQRETGAILHSLITHQGQTEGSAVPVGVHGRLELVRTLQDQLVRDRDLRRALLEGLQDGVVLWSASGDPLLANQATERLWRAIPVLDEVAAVGKREPDDWGELPVEVEHHGRWLEIMVWPLEEAHLGLIRDVSTRRELDLRRREMQRLVSHELKTPLSSIAGFGAMLETYPLSEDELRRVAGLIRGEAERLGEMVRTFLDLERIGSGRWPGTPEPMDLGQVTRHRIDLLIPRAAERGQRIVVEAAQPASIVGAPRLVERLVDNLVENALKYSTERSIVEVTVTRSGDRSQLEVHDHGPGIPDEALPQLFERFYRVPGTQTTGSGLGLAVVKEVADWHGAAVEVVSRLGHGSTFTVRFPAPPEEEADDGSQDPGRR